MPERSLVTIVTRPDACACDIAAHIKEVDAFIGQIFLSHQRGVT